ncbi:MAG: nodulation protein NfeD [Dehalococcoidia bacterium]
MWAQEEAHIRPFTRRPFLWALIVLALAGAGCASDPPQGAVHVLTADGAVDHVLPRYLERGIEQAEDERAAAVLVRVDTPGGAVTAMRDAVGVIENARVPVITFVGPAGAQAASAGTFLAMAGHVAAMAPSTTIGAATPVTATGEDVPGALGEKVENDIAALARGIAETHGRNGEWAEQAVREAASASGAEAVELEVVDFLADDIAGVLEQADGRDVRLAGGLQVTMEVADAQLVENGVNGYERMLRIIGDPLIASLLLLVGFGLLYLEAQAPGTFVPGAAGVLAILAALVGIGSLLPQDAAVALIGGGVLLLLLEVFVPGGVLGSIGAVGIMVGLATLLAGSTAIDLRLLLMLLGIALTATGLAVGVAVAMIARGYIARNERSGGARL